MNSQTPTQSYNQAVLELAVAGLAALEASGHNRAQRTPAQESHFLCSWMADSLKEKRFSKLVAEDLATWIRQGRSLGAGANLPSLLGRIVSQYRQVLDKETGLGTGLKAMLTELQALGWLIFTDAEVDTKLKLDSEGQSSLIISAGEFERHIQDGELIKPITLYVRADEKLLAETALANGLLLSQGNKKSSLVKHHKAYRLRPANRLDALCLLV
ncbi:DUF2913 family protein [Shewanella sp. AS16]|uniref:DUF2913 family protein n=1 Tax=Shewanella sp. AS16 TaxID=2907625 RepID=UPI001F2CE905|nr:DUF2913 family protein [Shewanella sp. AS16]MCE9686453.1 DUF2913 family protein [Shewanella sp. AS16]